MARRKIRGATDQRPFIMVYQDFLESDLLDNYYQKLIYIYLKKFADSNNQCFPSIKKLSNLTKIGATKVKQTLVELEEKGVISKANRSRADGGKSSNLYTLYDYSEIWGVGSSEDVAAVAEEVSEAKMVAALRAKGYTVQKEKELESSSTDQSNDEPSTQLNQYVTNKNTPKTAKSQERYTLEEVKALFDYPILLEWEPENQADIDAVMNILHDTLNETKATIRVSGQDKPAMVVIGRLMKLNYEELLHALHKYQAQTGDIKNPAAYMLTLLYHAKEQYGLELTNKVQQDLN